MVYFFCQVIIYVSELPYPYAGPDQQLCEYLNISEKEFHDTKNKFVNKKLFEFLNGKWLPKFKVGET